MSALLLIVLAIVIFVVAYLTYGRYLAKTWGIDPSRTTPAHELEDGVDYVPAKTAVLMGHHFSSIAGAGPINGPKSPTTSSTGGLVEALKRAIITARPKGRCHKRYYWSAIKRYFLSLLFLTLLPAPLYISLLLLLLYYQLLKHSILSPRTLCPICSADMDACHIS